MRGLFAHRRMGKSEFLKHDLLPAALRAGYQATYANLWDDNEHPGQALATAIVQAVQPKGMAKFWEHLNTPICKLKGSGKLPVGLKAGLELDLTDKEKAAVPAIQAALLATDKSKKRLLQVIDEAQVLASHLDPPAHRRAPAVDCPGGPRRLPLRRPGVPGLGCSAAHG